MRFVIMGAGAIGGVVGVRLHQGGHDVVLIARGAHGEAIAAHGLRLETPEGVSVHHIPVAPNAAEAGLTEGDVALICVKGQDTLGALLALRDAYPPGLPVVLLQNGVENERTALRVMGEVYGAAVLIPAAHLKPGVVQSFATGRTGKVDIGRYPGGVDDRVRALCAAFSASRFESVPNPAIMDAKYEKLLENLANAPQVICGVGAPGLDRLIEAARTEGRTVLDAAGITYLPPDPPNRAANFSYDGIGEIPDRPAAGASTWQSLARGRPLESDYLTGEIVLQARLGGLAVPVNELILSLVHRTAREGLAPGWISAEEILTWATDDGAAEANRAAG